MFSLCCTELNKTAHAAEVVLAQPTQAFVEASVRLVCCEVKFVSIFYLLQLKSSRLMGFIVLHGEFEQFSFVHKANVLINVFLILVCGIGT